VADVALVNPRTKTAPLFRSARDQRITVALHSTSVVLDDEGDDGWRVSQVLMFMMNAALTEHRSADELAVSSQCNVISSI
jgi:hypothetical protein